MSKKFSSVSHILNRSSKSVTDGAISSSLCHQHK